MLFLFWNCKPEFLDGQTAQCNFVKGADLTTGQLGNKTPYNSEKTIKFVRVVFLAHPNWVYTLFSGILLDS